MVFVAKAATATDAAAQLKNFGATANVFSGEKALLAFSGAVALQLFVHCFDVFAFNVALVGSKSSAESAGDMHQLVDERPLFVFRGHLVVDFGDNLYGVGGGKVQYALPDFA